MDAKSEPAHGAGFFTVLNSPYKILNIADI